MSDILFQPVSLGAIQLSNRIIMAPMTRDRAGDKDVPTDLMVEYYRQRATAGLIITEGTQPSQEGKGYWRTPGIHNAEQIAGWKKVTDAVHGEGGKIVMQIMHCGRVVVPANRGFEADVIAPSAIACPDPVPGPDGMPTETAMPREIHASEIPQLIEEFAEASRNAVAAGMDGVELHCTSGYLINQFLNPASNQRGDEWGGNVENRIRFPIAVLKACADVVGPDRVGFRISPGNPYNGMDTTSPEETFAPLISAADKLGLAYLHLVNLDLPDLDVLAMVRTHWSGKVITNNNLDAAKAREILDSGKADAVSFGRAFIANPDLVARIKSRVPLTTVDRAHIYTGEEKGYTDYPVI